MWVFRGHEHIEMVNIMAAAVAAEAAVWGQDVQALF